jgi:hypothetical protein
MTEPAQQRAAREILEHASNTAAFRDELGAAAEEPPMVDAPGEKFAEVMEQILGDIESYQSIASAGPAFAKTWHDGAVSARAMIPFLSLPIRN